jgi:hypothetical protein
MTSLMGMIGAALFFLAYECWLLYYVMKKQKRESEMYWRNYNNYLESP